MTEPVPDPSGEYEMLTTGWESTVNVAEASPSVSAEHEFPTVLPQVTPAVTVCVPDRRHVVERVCEKEQLEPAHDWLPMSVLSRKTELIEEAPHVPPPLALIVRVVPLTDALTFAEHVACALANDPRHRRIDKTTLICFDIAVTSELSLSADTATLFVSSLHLLSFGVRRHDPPARYSTTDRVNGLVHLLERASYVAFDSSR
ncbi:MAG TPA: hypothetical protein VN181_07610 [Thermoanaerobaculia bacterium]|nr:hypothetical protein [Thermoanaerobaculia bacterium]